MSKQTLAPIVDKQQTKQSNAPLEVQTTKPLEQATTSTTLPDHDLAKRNKLDMAVTKAANALQDVKKCVKTRTGRPKRDHDTEDETSTIGSCPSINSLTYHGNVSGTSYGRWTLEEHEGFLEGLKLHGREWKKVSGMIPTRTSAQIRSHAQKYFAKMAKEGLSEQGTSLDGASGVAGVDFTSATFVKKIELILRDPTSVEKEVETKLGQLHNLHQKLLRRLEAKRAVAKEKKRRAENNARSATATSEMQTLLDDAEAEMRVTKKMRLDNHRQLDGKSLNNLRVGPATAALARRLEEEANKSSPEHSGSDTSNCLQQMFASSKKASVSCNDLNEVCNGTNLLSKDSANSLHSGVHVSSAVNSCVRDNSTYMSNEMIALEVLGGGSLSQSCSDLSAHGIAHQQHPASASQPQDAVNLKRKVV